jgi:hypothetical protein
MKPICEIYELLRFKIFGTKKPPVSSRMQKALEYPGISEEFKQQVTNFIERYREALEALAKE